MNSSPPSHSDGEEDPPSPLSHSTRDETSQLGPRGPGPFSSSFSLSGGGTTTGVSVDANPGGDTSVGRRNQHPSFEYPLPGVGSLTSSVTGVHTGSHPVAPPQPFHSGNTQGTSGSNNNAEAVMAAARAVRRKGEGLSVDTNPADQEKRPPRFQDPWTYRSKRVLLPVKKLVTVRRQDPGMGMLPNLSGVLSPVSGEIYGIDDDGEEVMSFFQYDEHDEEQVYLCIRRLDQAFNPQSKERSQRRRRRAQRQERRPKINPHHRNPHQRSESAVSTDSGTTSGGEDFFESFSRPPPEEIDRDTCSVAVGICFYNEEALEMERTLNMLVEKDPKARRNQKELEKKRRREKEEERKKRLRRQRDREKRRRDRKWKKLRAQVEAGVKPTDQLVVPGNATTPAPAGAMNGGRVPSASNAAAMLYQPVAQHQRRTPSSTVDSSSLPSLSSDPSRAMSPDADLFNVSDVPGLGDNRRRSSAALGGYESDASVGSRRSFHSDLYEDDDDDASSMHSYSSANNPQPGRGSDGEDSEDEPPLEDLESSEEEDVINQRAHWMGQEDVPPEVYQHFCLLQDGWPVASASMRKYCATLFSQYDRSQDLQDILPSDDEEIDLEAQTQWNDADQCGDWRSRIPDHKLTLEEKRHGLHRRTYVLEYVKKVRGSNDLVACPAPHGPMKGEFITLVIKGDNRRKHNSHRWFFDGYCKERRPDFTFTTDTGTGFDKNCMGTLYRYLLDENNSQCVGVTGRQRVMQATMQGSRDGMLDAYLRQVQSADYESAYAMSTGAYTLFGLLPVLPGPCALLRFRAIEEKVLPYYFETAEAHIEQTGMILGNLKIAEDRIVSYATVLKSDIPGAYTAWVPDATFYFQAETDMEPFIAQRRRWLNGTLCGYIYLAIQKPRLLWGAKSISCFRAFFLHFLLLCQLLTFFITFLSPAITLIGLHFALPFFFHDAHIMNNTFFYLSVATWVLFAAVHAVPKWQKFNMALFLILFVFNLATISLNIAAFVIFYLRKENPLDLLFWLVVGVAALPFFIAFIHDWISLGRLIVSMIPYYIFLPTFVGGFIVYAAARTWDLTWGNRVTTQESLFEGAAQLNQEAEDEEKRRQQQFNNNLHNRALGGLFFLLILNTAAVVLTTKYESSHQFIFFSMVGIFSTTLVQAFFSIIFFLKYHVARFFRCFCGCLFCFFCVCRWRKNRKARELHNTQMWRRKVHAKGLSINGPDAATVNEDPRSPLLSRAVMSDGESQYSAGSVDSFTQQQQQQQYREEYETGGREEVLHGRAPLERRSSSGVRGGGGYQRGTSNPNLGGVSTYGSFGATEQRTGKPMVEDGSPRGNKSAPRKVRREGRQWSSKSKSGKSRPPDDVASSLDSSHYAASGSFLESKDVTMEGDHTAPDPHDPYVGLSGDYLPYRNAPMSQGEANLSRDMSPQRHQPHRRGRSSRDLV